MRPHLRRIAAGRAETRRKAVFSGVFLITAAGLRVGVDAVQPDPGTAPRQQQRNQSAAAAKIAHLSPQRAQPLGGIRREEHAVGRNPL